MHISHQLLEILDHFKMPSLPFEFTWKLLGIHFACLGCSKKEMDEMVSKAKESASELSDKSGNLLEKAKKVLESTL